MNPRRRHSSTSACAMARGSHGGTALRRTWVVGDTRARAHSAAAAAAVRGTPPGLADPVALRGLLRQKSSCAARKCPARQRAVVSGARHAVAPLDHWPRQVADRKRSRGWRTGGRRAAHRLCAARRARMARSAAGSVDQLATDAWSEVHMSRLPTDIQVVAGNLNLTAGRWPRWVGGAA